MSACGWRPVPLAAAAVAAASIVCLRVSTGARVHARVATSDSQAAVTQAPASTAASLVADGFARLDENRIDDAKTLFERAMAIAREQGDRRVEAHALRGLGRMWAQKFDAEAAREALTQSIAIFDTIGDTIGLAQAWNQVGTNAFYAQRWTDAEDGYRRALAGFERAGLAGEEANVLRNLTFLPSIAHDARVRLIAAAVERATAAKQPVMAGLSLHTWGDLLVLSNDYAAAITKLDESRVLLEAHGTGSQLARLYTSIGRMYRLHGEPALALPFYARAIERQRASRDVAGEVQSLNAMGIASHVLGRAADARAHFARALTLARQGGNLSDVHWIERQFGMVLTETGDAHAGASHLEAGLRAEIVDDERARALGMLARAYSILSRHAEAEAAATEAIALAEGTPDLEARRAARFARARARRAAGRAADAVADTREALKAIAAQRPGLVQTDALRLGFGERMRHVFDFAVSLFSEVGLHEDALVASEQGRSRAFLELLAAGRGLSSRAATADPASLDGLKETAARLQSAVLSYWVTPRETFIWLVLQDGEVRSRVVRVTAARLDALSRQIAPDPPAPGTGLAARGADQAQIVAGPRAEAACRQLYDLLILPVRQWMPRADGSLLTIVPDGPLHRVSFAALRHERGRYLLEGYQLHYTSAVSALAPAGARDGRAGGSARLLVIANPTVAAATTSASRLAPLPGAVREARAIAARWTSSAVDIIGGADATEARVRADAGGYDALHFAAHGVVRDDQPMDSFLALAAAPFSGTGAAPGSAAGTDRDGRLTAREIYDLDLRASLVVLSACRGAAGRVTGDGIVGLTRAFMAAGVPAVVASAWDLPDETTPRLFETFYASRANGEAASAAIRRAQLELLGALRRGEVSVETAAGAVVVPEHPSVWAGLMLWGAPGRW